MGKNNRARRAAKAKARRTDYRAGRPGPTPPSGGFQYSAREQAEDWLDLAASRLRAGDRETAVRYLDKLATLPPSSVGAEIESTLMRRVARLFAHGWQPAEVLRQVRRSSTPPAARLTGWAILSEATPKRPDTMHPDWHAQLVELRTVLGAAEPSSPTGWLGTWQHADTVDRPAAVDTAVHALAALYQLGPIPEVIPPPGHSPAASAPRGQDHPILAKVRALLAQAESTTFPAEAEAFTAKAQELMTRHAIDQAMLSEQPPGSQPRTRRIAIDDPYIDAKSYLMQIVAEHSRCRAVFHSSYAFSSIVGFEGDLDAAELLFTSLLVQAQVALTSEARNAPAGARTRSRSFRSSFLVAYARRIGDRLADINLGVISTVEADTKRSALPVLAARRKEVDDAVDAQFGELHASSVRSGWDGLGSMRGRLAADRAQLNFGDLEGTSGEP